MTTLNELLKTEGSMELETLKEWHRITFVLFWGAGIAIGCGLPWIFYSVHKDAPKLRAECEARGGMFISTRSELYSCVGKPPALPAMFKTPNVELTGAARHERE